MFNFRLYNFLMQHITLLKQLEPVKVLFYIEGAAGPVARHEASQGPQRLQQHHQRYQVGWFLMDIILNFILESLINLSGLNFRYRSLG